MRLALPCANIHIQNHNLAGDFDAYLPYLWTFSYLMRVYVRVGQASRLDQVDHFNVPCV